MSDSTGFTLVETLLASAVILLAILGAASMSLVALGTVDDSGEQTTAVWLGQQRIEWLRNQGYDSTAMNPGTTVETLTGTYDGYSRTTTVVADTPRAGVKQVTVRVDMPSGRVFQLTALVTA